MLKRLINKVKGLFKAKPPSNRPKVGDIVGNVVLGYKGLKPNPEQGLTQEMIDRMRQSQLDKHTNFKIGESYRLGEAIVTLRRSKAEVAKIIRATDRKRRLKEKKLRARAIDIMMMSPEEIHKLQAEEWLAKRMPKEMKIDAIMKPVKGKRMLQPTEEQPDGSKAKRINKKFKKITSEAHALEKDKVK